MGTGSGIRTLLLSRSGPIHIGWKCRRNVAIRNCWSEVVRESTITNLSFAHQPFQRQSKCEIRSLGYQIRFFKLEVLFTSSGL